MLGSFRLSILVASVLFCSAVVCSAQVPHSRPDAMKTVWSGDSGAYRWRWTTRDLTAARIGTVRPVFSALAYEKRTNTQLKEEKSDPVDTYLECSIAPLSIVGGIASYQRDYYWEGGAHPSGSTDFVSIDVVKPNHLLLLTDLFRDSDIVKALLADKIVADTLKRNHITELPRTTAQLTELLKGKAFGGDDNDKYEFEADLLSRFAFHHVEGDRVAVRLEVRWGSEIYRFSSTQIGLLLPIPAHLRGALQLAADRRQGFLMADSKKLAGKSTTILLTLGKAPQ